MDDLISRAAAIKSVCTMLKNCFNASEEMLESVKITVGELPTAQPSATDTNVATTDTISRAAALEAMDTWDKFGCDPDGKLVRYDDDKHYVPYVHYDDMVHAIKHLPPAYQWVYVKDRLPKTVINRHTQDYQEYICLCDFGRYGYDVRTYKFGGGHFWNGGRHDVDRYVIAWQPLPEIPDTLRLNHQEGGMDD